MPHTRPFVLMLVAFEKHTQSLTRASRATILTVPFEELFHKLYKLRIAPCFALSQSYKHSHFRAAYASLRAHACCLRKAHAVSYARFACDDPDGTFRRAYIAIFIVKNCIFGDTIDKNLSKSTVLTNVGDIKV